MRAAERRVAVGRGSGTASGGKGRRPARLPRVGRTPGRHAKLALAVLCGIVVLVGTTGAEPLRRAVGAGTAERLAAWIAESLPEWTRLYRHLHANPELSLREERTAREVARFLRARGYDVETEIGGHGVIGVLRNGEGPTLLIRGDMDALPVTEATGLPFASEVRTRNEAGALVGTMHACGHDVHVTSLLGTASSLRALREDWRGTVVILAQPAEELGRGARMMIEDGLFDRIPAPDHGISLHVDDALASGHVGLVPGWAAANVDSVVITVFGRGGHGARPHRAIDPIVASAHLVTALQTIVSRRIEPGVPAVVTVGSIHGGSKSNVIPDEVVLELTVRSYEDAVRDQLLGGIEEIARATCLAFECPRPPRVEVRPDHTPAMYNDPALTAHARAVFEALLGPEAVERKQPTMGGEDFARYWRVGGFPTLQYRLGSVAPERIAESEAEGGEPLPSLHSSRYAPDERATLETGVRTLTHLALSLLGQGER